MNLIRDFAVVITALFILGQFNITHAATPSNVQRLQSEIKNLHKIDFPSLVNFNFFLKGTQDVPRGIEVIKRMSNLNGKKILVYIHGYLPLVKNLTEAGAIEIKDTLFATRQYVDHVVLVDWIGVIQRNNLDVENIARAVTSMVADEVYKVLDLFEKKGASPLDIGLIGHGKGAHICGQVGKLYFNSTGKQLSAILGLDPAGPSFKDVNIQYRLSKGDAEIVKLIHTDKIYGIYRQGGDLDEFPYVEPFCKNKLDSFCWHYAAIKIYLMTLKGEKLPTKELCTYPVIILVLDASGSMSGSRLTNLDTSSKRIISYLPTKSQIAIVVFGTAANVTLQPLEIKDKSSRDQVIAALPPAASYGMTSIGAGLQAAVNVMNSNKAMECAHITLITDGDENTPPYMIDVAKKIPQCSNVHCIAFGDSADTKLEQVCDGTSAVSDVNSGTKLLKTEWDSLYADMNTCTRLIRLPVKTVKVGETVNFYIDKSLQKQLSWVINMGDARKLNITLKSPNKVYGAIDFTPDPTQTTLELKLPWGENGRWAMSVSKTTVKVNFRKKRDVSEDSVLVFVTAEAPSEEDGYSPILINAQLSSNILDYTIPGNVTISAKLTQGDNVIIRAEVKAFIASPTNESDVKIIHLRDDGVGADQVEDDGIYSRYLTVPLKKLSGGFRYEVSVIAEGVIGTKIRNFGEGSTIFAKLTETELNSFEESEPFEREITAGSIRPISDYIEPLPAQVRDLKVNDVDVDAQLVTLSWTAPGLMLDEGTALSYSLSVKTFSSFEDEGAPRQEGEVEIVSGSLDPLPSGSLQNVTLKIPDNLWQASLLKSSDNQNWSFPLLYFKIQAEGWDGRFGEESNFASSEQYVMEQEPVITSEEEDDRNIMYSLFGILMLLLVCISSVPVYCCCRRKKKTTYQSCDRDETDGLN